VHDVDAELVLLLLYRLPAAHGQMMAAIRKKALGAETSRAVGLVPAARRPQRQERVAEQGAGAEQLAHHGNEESGWRCSEAVADAVQERQPRARSFIAKASARPEHDAVGDDQADEHRQLPADLRAGRPAANWSTTITSEAMIVICTMIGRSPARPAHHADDRQEKAVTARQRQRHDQRRQQPEVTASAEQYAQHCRMTGLFSMIGSISAFWPQVSSAAPPDAARSRARYGPKPCSPSQ